MARKRDTKPNGSSSGRSLVRPLARVGDPLVLHGGQVIEPTLAGGVQVEKHDAKPREYKSTKRRNIGELPAAPRVLNGIACVFMYSLLGVGDREIAEALNIATTAVREVRKHPGYSEIFELIQEEFINVNSERIQSRIAAYGDEAVTQMAHLMMNGKFEATKLKASQDLLDRGGHSRKDGVKGGMGDALRIVVTNGDQKTEVSIGGSEVMPN